MTWNNSSPCGAIIYPAGPVTIPDFAWASGVFGGGTGWTAAGGVSPTLSTGHGEVAGYSLRIHPAAGTSYAHAATMSAWPWDLSSTNPFYIYMRMAGISGSGTLRAQIEYRNAAGGGGLLRTDELAVTIVADGLQHVYRTDALAAPPGGTLYFRLIVGAPSGADTYDAYVDWVVFGHAFDLQDQFPGPVLFESPMDDTLTQDRIVNIAENGEAEVTRFAQLDGSPGYRMGRFNEAYFDDTGLATAEAAWVYLSGHDNGASRMFTLIGQMYDLTRNFIANARFTSPQRGIKLLAETMLYSWEQSWEEIRWASIPAGVSVAGAAAGDKVLVVEFVNLIGGAASLYLSTGPVRFGISSNLYYVLKRNTVQRSNQEWNPITFDPTFPEYSFACVDAGMAITKILSDNASYLERCIIKIWSGDDLRNFADFNRKWIGRFTEPERADGLLKFTSASAFSDLDFPIQPIVGAAELNADVTDPTALTIALRNVVGLDRTFPNLVLNPGFESALGVEWKDDVPPVTPPAGTLAGASAGVLLRSTLTHEEGAASLRDSSAINSHTWYYRYQKISVNLLNIYSASMFMNSDGCDDAADYGGGQMCVIVEEYDAGNVLLSSTTTGILQRPQDFFKAGVHDLDPDIQLEIWASTGVAYTPANNASYIKLYLLSRQGGAANPGSRNAAFDNVQFQSGVLMRWDNEISSVSSISNLPGATTGAATLAARGMFGSLPKRHTAASTSGAGSSGQGSGGQCLFYNRYSGHFLDILRRLITTTSAGTNGAYDDGSGVGLGAYFDATWLGGGWNTEKTYVNAGSGPINSYDHSKYLMDFTFDARIDNFKQLAVKECLLPMATIWYIDDTGALDVAILHELEAGGAGTILPRDVMNDGKIVYDTAPLEEVFNTFTYRFDHDPMGTNDVQGSKVGPTPFITERIFTEKEMGDEATPSLVRFQERPMIFDVRGLRGYGSVQYGLSWAYNGDRTAYERARVWLSRQRFRVPKYDISLALRKEGLKVGSSLDVTSNAMVNSATAVLGRSASKMILRSLTGPDYSSGLLNVCLSAYGDLAAIANTETAAAMPTPAMADWALVKRPAQNNAANTLFEKISIGFRRARVYVRGFCNLATVILQYNGAPPPTAPVDGSAPQIPDYMMTRVFGSPKLLLATDLAATYFTNAALGQIGCIQSLTPYAGGTTYPLGKVVQRATNDLFYRSLQAGNTGHTPESNLSVWWELYPATDVPADYGAYNGALTFPINAIVTSGGLFYKSLQAANIGHTPASSPTWWTPITPVSDYQVVTEMRAPLAEENIMFSSGNNTQLNGTGGDTAGTQKQLMFIRLAYVNDDWVEGSWSGCRVVAGANFSDDLGDRMYRGKLMQTITSSNGQTRTTWGSGRS